MKYLKPIILVIEHGAGVRFTYTFVIHVFRVVSSGLNPRFSRQTQLKTADL